MNKHNKVNLHNFKEFMEKYVAPESVTYFRPVSSDSVLVGGEQGCSHVTWEYTANLILSPIAHFTLPSILPLPQDSPSILHTSRKRQRERKRHNERERDYKSDIYCTSVPIQHGHSSVGLPVTGHHQVLRQLSLLPLLLLLIGATATK